MIPANTAAKKPFVKRDAARTFTAVNPVTSWSAPRSCVANETRRVILHPAPAYAATPISQAIGLMFARDAGGAGHSVVFPFSVPKRDAVSMFFVRDPIDILLLDGDFRVMCMRERLLPWQVWLLPVHASYMIELPAGVIQSSRTAIGDVIALPAPDRCVHMWTLREYVLFFAFQTAVFAILLIIAAGIMAALLAIRANVL